VAATLVVNQNTSSTLPQGWTSSGINGGGSSSYANGVFTVSNQGGSLSGTWDGLQFAYTPMVGDGTVVARMTGFGAQNNSDAGVMLRTGPTPTSAMMYVGIENWAVMVKWRTATGQGDQSWTGPAVSTPYWFKLVRTTNNGSVMVAAYASPNGTDWTQMGSTQTLSDAGTTLYGGLSVAGVWGYSPVTATFDSVSVVGSNGGSTADFSLSAPTATQTANAGESISIPVTVNTTGGFNTGVTLTVDPATLPSGATASFSPATVTGAGTSTLILNLAASPTGSFTISVNGVSGSLNHSTTVALTVTSASGQPPSMLPVSPVSGSGTSGTFTFAATDPNGQASNISWMEMLFNSSLSGVQACYVHYDQATQTLYLRDDTDPSWVGSAAMPMGSGVKLMNSQCTVTGATATVSGGQLTVSLTASFTQAFAGAQNIYGIVDTGSLNSSWDVLGSWTVTLPAGALPANWSNAGINAGGSVTYANGVYTVQNQGASLGGTYDGLQFGYTPLVGDGTIVARMTGFGAATNSDAGIMLRTGPTPTAAMVYVGIENGAVSMKSRSDTGLSVQVDASTPSVATPYWFELRRINNVITAYASADGVSWTQVGQPQTLNVQFGSTMYAGVMVAGVWGYSPITATFDNVSVVKSPPDFLITVPSGLQTVQGGGSVTIPVNVVTIGGFSGVITLTASSLSPGTTASFSPATLSSTGSSTLTLTTATSPGGYFSTNVTGTSGTFIHTAAITLKISGPIASAYRYYRTVTIDHTKVGAVGATDQQNFPVLVSGVYPYLAATTNGGKVQNPSGYDIAFSTDINGSNVLNWEIQSYDPVSGTVNFWVQVPTLSHTADTVIYMFYGSPSITVFQGGAGSAWDSNFAAVYHLGNGTTIGLSDSTLNGNTLTNHGATASAGPIVGAASFNRTASQFMSTPSLSLGTVHTASVWVRPNGQNGAYNFGPVLGNNTGSNIDPIYVGGSTDSSFGYTQGTAGAGVNVSSMTGAWHYLVSVRNGLNISLYLDGASVGSGTLPANEAATIGYIGARNSSANLYYTGAATEVRLSNTTRSADWISTEYNNQSSPSTFYAVGSESQP
jgi:hypothetical protein